MPNYLVSLTVITYPRLVVTDAPNIDEAVEFAKRLIPPTGEVVDAEARPFDDTLPVLGAAQYRKDP